jgi:hypothetical protein
MQTLKIVIDIVKRDRNENVAVEQAQLDKIISFVCIFKLI